MPKKLLLLLLLVLVPFCIPATLKKTHIRPGGNVEMDTQLKKEIAIETRNMSGAELREYSVNKTADLLHFSRVNDIENGRANCVGYARLCSAVFNYSCKINKINHCESHPVVGTIMYCGIDLCKVLQAIVPKEWKNFVKDHDFVQFNIDNDTIFADPTMKDYLDNAFITVCKKTQF